MTDEQLTAIWDEGGPEIIDALRAVAAAARTEFADQVIAFLDGEYPLTRKPLQDAIRALAAKGGQDG